MNPKQLRILAASSGNLVEWFIFYVYLYSAIYFASSFFPAGDSTTQLLKAAGIFAIGFWMRPVGAWFFGRLADRHGRRLAMMVSILMMCATSLLIACLPTYAHIGSAAPILLLCACLIQGFSLGGEYGISATYFSEMSEKGRRGFFASFQAVTLTGGQLLALLAMVLLQHILPEAQLQAWGWRILFVLGACGALVVLWLRRSLQETASATARAHRDAGTLRGVWRYKKSLFTSFVFTASGALTFYAFTTYMLKYLINTAGMDAKTASVVVMSAIVGCLLLCPLFGALSDRIGRRTMMILFSALTMLCTIPIMQALKTVSNPYIAFSLVMCAVTILTFYASISGVMKAELFPIEVRALGVSITYAAANAVFGGTAEYVALSMKALGIESSFYWYVSAFAFLSFLLALRMPDSRLRASLQEA